MKNYDPALLAAVMIEAGRIADNLIKANDDDPRTITKEINDGCILAAFDELRRVMKYIEYNPDAKGLLCR